MLQCEQKFDARMWNVSIAVLYLHGRSGKTGLGKDVVENSQDDHLISEEVVSLSISFADDTVLVTVSHLQRQCLVTEFGWVCKRRKQRG